MKKIAITTDSNSGILPDEGKSQNVFILPMPFLVNGNDYFENVNLTQEKFYELLDAQANVSTSQPSVGELGEFWTDILKDFDEIIHLPMSSGLSQSCATATALSNEPEFKDKVFVVDNRRISVPLKESIFDAVRLRDEGKSSEEIVAYLKKTGDHCSIYIAVDTMKYLKRGGRVTAAAAAIGTILKIKPVLQIHGEKLDKYALARSSMKAKEAMIAAIKNDLETCYAKYAANGEMTISVAYTKNDSEAQAFVQELKKAFPNIPFHYCDPLPLSISCHIGPGALGVATIRVLK